MILKYNQIGCLLDSVDEDAMRDGDAAALANAKLIVAEMARIKGQIDAFPRSGGAPKCLGRTTNT